MLTEAKAEDDCAKVVDEYHQLLKTGPKTVFKEGDGSEDEELDQKLFFVCVTCAERNHGESERTGQSMFMCRLLVLKRKHTHKQRQGQLHQGEEQMRRRK